MKQKSEDVIKAEAYRDVRRQAFRLATMLETKGGLNQSDVGFSYGQGAIYYKGKRIHVSEFDERGPLVIGVRNPEANESQDLALAVSNLRSGELPICAYDSKINSDIFATTEWIRQGADPHRRVACLQQTPYVQNLQIFLEPKVQTTSAFKTSSDSRDINPLYR